MVRSLAPMIVIAGGLASTLGSGPAAANPVKSLYTTVDLKVCRQVKRHRDGGAWRCEGLGGLPVYVAEGDLRQFVSVGADAQKRRAATQTLGAFNSIFRRAAAVPPSSGVSIAAASASCPTPSSSASTPRATAATATCWWCRRCPTPKPVMWPTSTRSPTRTPSRLPARSPTARRRASIAARSHARRGRRAAARCDALPADDAQCQVNATFSSRSPPMRV